MNRGKMFLVLSVVGAAVLCTSSAFAELVRYDTEAAFNAANTDRITNNLSDITPNGWAGVGKSVTSTNGSLTVTVKNSGDIYAPTTDNTGKALSLGGTLLIGGGGADTSITLGTPVTAIGLVGLSYSTTLPTTLYVNLSDGSKQKFTVVTTSLSNSFYLGFTETTPGLTITGITLEAAIANETNGGFGFTNLSVVSAVPEPSTTMMMLTGAVALLAYGWRKRK